MKQKDRVEIYTNNCLICVYGSDMNNRTEIKLTFSILHSGLQKKTPVKYVIFNRKKMFSNSTFLHHILSA